MDIYRYDDAVECLYRALAEDPDHARAHALLAICLLEQGSNDKALSEARRAIQLDAEAAFNFYVLGWIHARRGRLNDSRRVLDEGLRLDPTYVDLHELKSDVHLGLRQLESALESAREGLSYEPRHLGCLNRYARALQRLGRSREAHEILSDALSLDPSDAETHSNLGQVLISLGRPEDARAHLREALRIDPTRHITRKRFAETMRLHSVSSRRLRSLLTRIDAFTEEDPAARFVAGAVLVLLLVGASQFPGAHIVLIPVILVVAPIASLLLFARPVMNFVLRNDPLTQVSLTWIERAAALCVPIAGTWTLTVVLAAFMFGLASTIVVPALSVLGCVGLGAVHWSRDELDLGRGPLPWVVLAAVVWVGIVVAQCLGWLASVKGMAIGHILFAVSSVGIAVSLASESDEE